MRPAAAERHGARAAARPVGSGTRRNTVTALLCLGCFPAGLVQLWLRPDLTTRARGWATAAVATWVVLLGGFSGWLLAPGAEETRLAAASSAPEPFATVVLPVVVPPESPESGGYGVANRAVGGGAVTSGRRGLDDRIPNSTSAHRIPERWLHVYYPSCSVARAQGAAPIRRGQPGYRPGLDQDRNGIACG